MRQTSDAVLVVSFGGPEAPQEVMPFLRQVTAGRGIPDARLEEVAQHYYDFGGRSPVNDLGRALVAALADELTRRDRPLPVALGNRNAAPWLVDALEGLYDGGARHLVAVLTSAYSSYSSCRQYRENLADAVEQLAERGKQVTIDKIRPYADHPGFADTVARLTTDAIRQTIEGGADPSALAVVGVTHSIPTAMADTSGPPDRPGAYVRQHRAVLDHVAEHLAAHGLAVAAVDLAYCSRSGPPTQPWLEPDINDHLASLAERGIRHVVVSPFGFVADHMEVIYDLDTEAAATARRLGLELIRVPTVGTDPAFVAALADLIEDRAAGRPGAVIDGSTPARHTCPGGCCRNLRTTRPALCEEDPS